MHFSNQPIVDAEVRIVHPEARRLDFAQNTNEPVRRVIYNSPEAVRSHTLWNVEALRESMAESNIEYAILSGLAWNDGAIIRDNNAYVADCLDRYPDEFKGLYTPDPTDPEAAATEIMGLNEQRYIGVELIPKWQNTHINDPKLEPIFDAVRRRNFFMKVYTAHPTQTLDGDAPYRTLQFLKEHSEIKTLIPHLGGLLCLYGLWLPIREALKNAYFITSVSATMKMVEFAAAVNPDNLVFGTDFPFNHCFDQITPLREMATLNIADDIKGKILSGTALSIFQFGRNNSRNI